MMNDEIVILDFETTGLSIDDSRIIEVGAAIVKGDSIVNCFSVLCDPGFSLPGFITSLTGITNQMLKGQPTPEKVMEEFDGFIGDRPIIAHNASFDGRFLKAEMRRIGRDTNNPMLCSMLLARRLIHDTVDHKLGTLKRFLNYQEEVGHRDHRALDDVKVTAALWIYLRDLVKSLTGGEVLTFKQFQKLSRAPKNKVSEHIEKFTQAASL